MLQQTQVKAVVPFWQRWMRALPTIHALARAKPQTIHKLWEGLGYYTRVRNMQRAARMVLAKHQGRFPTDFEDVLELPGIGRYTAGAICSIAFNQPQPILDGNVIRVIARLFGIDGNPRDRLINARLWDLARELVQAANGSCAAASPTTRKSQIANRKSRCSHLNQSLMELGALVCTARQPRCDVCPIAMRCVARKRHRVEELPHMPPRARVTRRRFVAFVACRDGRFLVRQRPAGVVNAHLWEFPNTEVTKAEGDPRKAALSALGATPVKLASFRTIQHSITRYRITLEVFQTTPHDSRSLGVTGGRWVTRSELGRLAFASAHRKIIALL